MHSAHTVASSLTCCRGDSSEVKESDDGWKKASKQCEIVPPTV